MKTTQIKWVSIAVIAVSILLLVRALPAEALQGALKDWIEGLGTWGPVMFAAIYVMATICLVPGSLLTLAAGAIFGLAVGFVTVSIAATTGAAFAFLISRYFARAKVEAMAKSSAKFRAVDDAISEGGWKIVGLLRLSPAIPFNWQNYLYGLTKIRFWPYVLTSWIAMMPGTFMYVYLGHVAGATSGGGEKSTAQWVLLVVGLVATISVTVHVTRLAKRQLKVQTELQASNDHADDGRESSPNNRSNESSLPAYGYAGAAVVALAIAIFAQLQSEPIATFLESFIGGGG